MMLKFEYIITLAFLLTNITYAVNVTNASEKSEEIQSELNKKCEEAREIKLKPLRDNLITECLAGIRNTEDHCTTFYSTYGDAIFHPNGHVQPRMFNEIPECLKAHDYEKSDH